jgi:hypothetical protein
MPFGADPKTVAQRPPVVKLSTAADGERRCRGFRAQGVRGNIQLRGGLVAAEEDIVARDLLRVWLKVQRITCHEEGDGWGTAEPYLWTVFFKIDGTSVSLTEGLTLTGSATVVGTPGSHGNLGDTDVDAGDQVNVPSAIGEWDTLLSPIAVPASLQGLVGADLPGVLGVACVLMEEDNVTDDGAEAGHGALNAAVTGALNDIIATRSFSNPNISEDEINAYVDALRDGVAGAIRDQQAFFENLWSWLNPDDSIGAEVFFWTHDDLAASGTASFSQRWREEGDWEISGQVDATVACSAEAAAAVSARVESAFRRRAEDIRAFRDRWFGGTQLPLWWALADRNAPQLGRVVSDDERAARTVAELMDALPAAAAAPGTPVADQLVDDVEMLLQKVRDSGSRRARIDASRALEVIAHVRGRTFEEAIRLLATVPPGRRPRPVRAVTDLLDPRLRVPRTLSDPLDSEGRP